MAGRGVVTVACACVILYDDQDCGDNNHRADALRWGHVVDWDATVMTGAPVRVVEGKGHW